MVDEQYGLAITEYSDFLKSFGNAVISAFDVSVFGDGSGRIAPMPDALGGDLKQWPALQTAAAYRNSSFFELLRQKAHYLMLPKSIIAAMISGPVDISEDDPGSGNKGVTSPPDIITGRVEMRVPGAVTAVVKIGFGLGLKVPLSEDLDGYYTTLGFIYHEMTHAWLFLHESDAEMQKLWTDGTDAYQNAYSVLGDPIDKEYAFSETAASYVQERIDRWCNALQRLDGLLSRVKPATRDELESIRLDFDRPVAPVVMMKDGAELSSPTLSDTLRDAIYKKVLDGLPLTQPHFNDTPLAALRNELARVAGLYGPW